MLANTEKEISNLLDLLRTIEYIVEPTDSTKKEINPYLSEIIVILKTFDSKTKNFNEVINGIKNLKEKVENDSKFSWSLRLRIRITLDETIYFLEFQKEPKNFANDWDQIDDYTSHKHYVAISNLIPESTENDETKRLLDVNNANNSESNNKKCCGIKCAIS